MNTTLQTPKLHNVKIKPEYLNAVVDGKKNFEIRKNDRGYRVGDRVRMSDGDRFVIVRIKYITDYAQTDNHIVFSFDWIQGGIEQIRKQDEAPKMGADSSMKAFVLCQDCLKVMHYTHERHNEDEFCTCGGQLCGCDDCQSEAAKRVVSGAKVFV
ncbi:DUF3850 domain-containing protein [Vibrio mediterranei]|uniref:ASCH domain-containing protein n=1 Tax=Vibrio mediterranei TaxID=689 RepID=A0AAN1FHX6_9VIBR|nr:DUF3850 domain-containing protein [Vibrio mediterranei]ASI90970.1 hypothetical protein BSZ05_14860 [Vibrio mediterranei]